MTPKQEREREFRNWELARARELQRERLKAWAITHFVEPSSLKSERERLRKTRRRT